MKKACVVFSSFYFPGLEIYTPTVFRVAAAFFFNPVSIGLDFFFEGF